MTEIIINYTGPAAVVASGSVDVTVSSQQVVSSIVGIAGADGADGIGGGATPAGVDGNIQFNDSGDLGASADLMWNKTNHLLGVGIASGLTARGTFKAPQDVLPPPAG